MLHCFHRCGVVTWIGFLRFAPEMAFLCTLEFFNNYVVHDEVNQSIGDKLVPCHELSGV